MRKVDERRVRKRNKRDYTGAPILYWMNRDQRVHDNWALLYAKELADQNEVPLAVCFNLAPGFLGGSRRQHLFKVDGLQEVERELTKKDIPFYLLRGEETEKDIVELVERFDVGAVVTDFFPLRLPQQWVRYVADNVSVPVYEVDAHNVVPAWEASDKQEYAARTIRPKLQKQLGEFLTDFPYVMSQRVVWPHEVPTINWQAIRDDRGVDDRAPEVSWVTPGEASAHRTLNTFLDERLNDYGERSNDPNADVTSDLSPYLHFGQISAQRVALEVEAKHGTRRNTKEAFLEQLIIRKELSDNYCFYQPHYDTPAGFPDWAQETLEKHKDDEREYVYTKDQFESAETHDELWNAAQMEMVKTGKMHNYMRMYWAKKILEWTNTPQYAQNVAIELNDRYELDGRDPNGYVGVAWAIGGVHDRGWTERPIFGKVRYMNRNGCERKFDVASYIERYVNQCNLET